MSSDWELMRSWAGERNEGAFAELVHRHINLVYGSAMRQVRDSELARDVTQAVFLVLSRKAGSLKEEVLLAGWLFRTTSHIAARAVRNEVRRRRRESEVFNMQTGGGNGEGNEYGAIEREIDSALAALTPVDRDALVIRFLEGHGLRAVGERLGVSEEAAKKRVSRAIDKVRALLAKRGVEITTAALGRALMDLRNEAAPELMAEVVAQTVMSESMAPGVSGLAEGASEGVSATSAVLAGAVAIVLLLGSGWAYWASRPNEAVEQRVTEQSSAIPPGGANPTSAMAKTAAIPGKSMLMLAIRATEDNQPIQAEVRVSLNNKSEPDSSEDLRADADGMVTVPVAGDRIYSLQVWVSAAGRVPLVLSWRAHEFVAPILQHTVHLNRGQKLEGVVRDEGGEPVEGARISFNSPGMELGRRENVAFRGIHFVSTDGQGGFRSEQLPLPVGDLAMEYVVDHPDFVRARIELSGVESIRTNQLVVLKRGVKVRGRVVDEFGNPVAGAKVVEAHEYADPKKTTQTDGGGEFEAGPFSPGGVNLAATAEGFQERKEHVPDVVSATNVVLKLAAATGKATDWDKEWAQRKTVRVFGKVIDAGNQQMISAFTVQLNEHSHTALQLLGEGHNGEFDWPVVMAFFQEFSLSVQADGYQPFETDVRPVKDGSAERFEVKMVPGSDIAGQVFSQSGEPVSGAFVGLSGYGFAPLLLDGCRPYEGGDKQTTTDANGRFRFKPVRGAKAVVVVHDLGCVQSLVTEVSKRPLVLRPWGAIEGRVMAGGCALAGQGVTLMPTIREDSDEYAGIGADGNVTTDQDGWFRYPKIPAGPITVCRYFNFNRDRTGTVGMNDYHDLEVPAGGVARVDLGGNGRTITGRLALSQAIPGYRWGDDLQSLNDPVAQEPISGGPPKNFHDPEWHKAMIRQERSRRTQHHYFLRIESDGTFRVENVAPGSYTLDITVTNPPDPTKRDYENHFRKQRGKVSQNVTVAEDDVDVGTVAVAIESIR